MSCSRRIRAACASFDAAPASLHSRQSQYLLIAVLFMVVVRGDVHAVRDVDDAAERMMTAHGAALDPEPVLAHRAPFSFGWPGQMSRPVLSRRQPFDRAIRRALVADVVHRSVNVPHRSQLRVTRVRAVM